MKVFLTHTETAFANYYGERPLAALRQHAEVVRNPTGRVLQGAALAEAAAGCDAIIADRATPGLAETFAAAPDLAAFLRCAVDIGTIDVPAASAAGVLVTRATPGFTDSVAELGMGLVIDLARGVSAGVQAARAGRAMVPAMGTQLRGATLGLVGYGRIAQRMAALARAFGMEVLANDPSPPAAAEGVAFLPLRDVLAGADFVVCLAPATPDTRDLMDAGAFAAMRRGAFFVNLARGELVDEAALAAALDSGHLGGAALDVGRAPDQMPSPALAHRPDVVATPHIGGLTRMATEHQAMDTVRQVAALAAGTLPEGAVNAEAAHRLSRLGR
ncbi:hydroxyacid dehydrogenase [Pseudoroseomonas rhizosphaerae]|uniref:Hydroxyacid dehydrogenase n=1 Tax=Teichococcus rhizosphaerae TaxID=1335062 RepID=A0A2C6Z9Y1_9PROT|nr:NAD(P)-dependent oxidoreductase [Pseudoroseomonas rhizosphaerae]PHK95321.1 hydroxyacid dehydrogenase [Pseudoroseomonas rhizosphaerae]